VARLRVQGDGGRGGAGLRATGTVPPGRPRPAGLAARAAQAGQPGRRAVRQHAVGLAAPVARWLGCRPGRHGERRRASPAAAERRGQQRPGPQMAGCRSGIRRAGPALRPHPAGVLLGVRQQGPADLRSRPGRAHARPAGHVLFAAAAGVPKRVHLARRPALAQAQARPGCRGGWGLRGVQLNRAARPGLGMPQHRPLLVLRVLLPRVQPRPGTGARARAPRMGAAAAGRCLG